MDRSGPSQVEWTVPESRAMEKPILESCTVEKIMPNSPTMEHPVPERPMIQKIKLGSPTMEESMTENLCRGVKRWRRPYQSFP